MFQPSTRGTKRKYTIVLGWGRCGGTRDTECQHILGSPVDHLPNTKHLAQPIWAILIFQTFVYVSCILFLVVCFNFYLLKNIWGIKDPLLNYKPF